MREMSRLPELPLRPMTLGELLDAAMALLRRRARVLLTCAAVLSVAEQLLLGPMRAAGAMTPPYYGPAENRLDDWWGVTTLGFGTEAAIVTLLGAIAGAAAGPALLGRPHVPRRTRPLVSAGTAFGFGSMAGFSAFLGFIPWFFVYGLFALAGPVLTIDRIRDPFSALGRSAVLAARDRMRGFRVLLAAWLTWFAIRVALGAGWTEVASAIFGGQWGRQPWLGPIAWILADTVAYAALACIAAVLVLDIRMRTEGLAIAIRRSPDPAAALVHVK
jgi:hypothetical protein